MIIKSYEIKKNKSKLKNNKFFLLYGENFGLKKDIKDFIISEIREKDEHVGIYSFYESDIFSNEESFYDSVYSGSLFSNKKIIIINNTTDKIIEKIDEIFNRPPENVFFIIFSNILEKKSKIRNFFEKEKKATCIACYLDNEKDLEIIAQSELKKNNIVLSREILNILIEKSNFDRSNLRNEIEKIKAYSFNKKKIGLDEIKSLVNLSGDYKSDVMVNECLSGNILQYKKIVSELYASAVNQILLLRILSNKIQRLLKMKEGNNKVMDLDAIINNSKPPIFWKDKAIVKKQLSIWSVEDLYNLITEVNNTELLCKKNYQISNSIFFNLFSKICNKANNFS
ncbi:MAG: DNA polymerase-3 subunit delta [Pelagibacterales bacterium]|nr:DNA polymerase-3 subunit delta [Pelagibacterales bacterium]